MRRGEFRRRQESPLIRSPIRTVKKRETLGEGEREGKGGFEWGAEMEKKPEQASLNLMRELKH